MPGEFGSRLDYEETLHEFFGATMHKDRETRQQRLSWFPPAGLVCAFEHRLLDTMRHDQQPFPLGPKDDDKQAFERIADLPKMLEESSA